MYVRDSVQCLLCNTLLALDPVQMGVDGGSALKGGVLPAPALPNLGSL